MASLQAIHCTEKNCSYKFSNKDQLDDHRRLMHQTEVDVTTKDGTRIMVKRGDDNMFQCPMPHCTKAVQNARYLRDHMSHCTPSNQQPTVPFHPSAVVVPYGDEIEEHNVLQKYHLVWNKRCKILICNICHSGIPVPEVHSHAKAEKLKLHLGRTKVLEELEPFATQMNQGPYPLDYAKGKRGPPIEGLLLYDGYTCKICEKSWRCKKTVNNHFCSEHHGKSFTHVHK
ncbi:hypothetical protein DFH28DRAFT_940386 [Melampsora americana]|nr:hypothetical protein DFH28DRAFT_940386 [Melampsora americana]